MTLSMGQTVLLVIDVQKAFEERDQRGDQRCNPQAESNILRLLTFFRERELNIKHIHHHSLDTDSLFRAELPGSEVQDFARPLASEEVYIKHVNSGFIGTNLEQDLRHCRCENVILCGATVNHCVETTTRMAGNLGFNTLLVSDAVWAYDAKGPDGRQHKAQDILSMTLCNMQGEFATVLSTDEVLAGIN